MKRKEGIAIIHELASKSDVFVENFLPGKTAEMGIDYDALSKINPRLMYPRTIVL
jgi:crotonobetainyl-CoA:carnitine CoA-transferase CaiB-like acyl-CoA transferase